MANKKDNQSYINRFIALMHLCVLISILLVLAGLCLGLTANPLFLGLFMMGITCYLAFNLFSQGIEQLRFHRLKDFIQHPIYKQKKALFILAIFLALVVSLTIVACCFGPAVITFMGSTSIHLIIFLMIAHLALKGIYSTCRVNITEFRHNIITQATSQYSFLNKRHNQLFETKPRKLTEIIYIASSTLLVASMCLALLTLLTPYISPLSVLFFPLSIMVLTTIFLKAMVGVVDYISIYCLNKPARESRPLFNLLFERNFFFKIIQPKHVLQHETGHRNPSYFHNYDGNDYSSDCSSYDDCDYSSDEGNASKSIHFV